MLYSFLKELTVEVNAYNNLNISNVSNETTSTSAYNNNSTSLFNKLIAQSANTEENDEEVSSSQGLASFSQDLATMNEKAKNAIINMKNEITTSSDKSNTHDELTLMLELKKIQAS